MDKRTIRSGHVYFVGHEANYVDQPPIKIGVTNNIEKRIKALQTGSPISLKLLGAIPFGGTSVEKQLHWMFREFRLNGEWFQANRKVLTFVHHYANPRIMRCKECGQCFEDWYNLHFAYSRPERRGITIPQTTQDFLLDKIDTPQNHLDGCVSGPHYLSGKYSESVKYFTLGWWR